MIEDAGGYGGLTDVELELKQWTLLTQVQPFDSKEQAESFISFYNKMVEDALIAEPFAETLITEKDGKFYIWYL